MFDLEKAIANWRREMFLAGIKSPETLDELEGHLRERIERLNAGLAEQDAFQTATQQLGEGELLKREFAKARHWFPRDNPAPLNFLAVWFILAGLNATLSLARMMFWVDWPGFPSLKIAYMLSWLGVFGLQIFVGMGLMRRRNFWRYCAFVAAALNSFGDICNFVAILRLRHINFSHSYYAVMGVMVPMSFQWVASLCEVCLMIWAAWYFCQPPLRALFSANSKSKSAQTS